MTFIAGLAGWLILLFLAVTLLLAVMRAAAYVVGWWNVRECERWMTEYLGLPFVCPSPELHRPRWGL